MTIPKAKYGLIGGSGTWGAKFPEDYKRREVKVLKIFSSFKTPFGKSAQFKLLEINKEKILRVATHGWTKDEKGNPLPTWICARQVAWVFSQAGVKYVLVDGSVGGIKSPEQAMKPLCPWSVVITDDFIMHWVPPTAPLYSPRKPPVRMREPFCQSLRQYLYESSLKQKEFKVYRDGIYICTSADRFETEAEIRLYGEWGAHIVGQTLGHEASLMRAAGIHFAALNIVANVAEGHVTWIGEKQKSMANFYRDCAIPVGNAIIDAMILAIKNGVENCHCEEYELTGLGAFPVKGA
jgi:5'-methylthioadenosine phosphorylase